MQIVQNIFMFIIPAVFALVIHNYLRHGELEARKKLVDFAIYFVLINIVTFMFSFVRGVKEINFAEMTLTYRIKYIGLGCVLAFVLPFPVCLMTEDVITIGGMKRYALRFGRDIMKYFRYSVRAAKAELRSEVANSYLNWLWWLIEPFCMMLIYTVIFGYVFNASEENFPIFIFIGLIMWKFFSKGISGSVDIVRKNKSIIKKVYMPKYILLFTKMLVNGFKMIVSFGIVLLMMLVFKVPVSWKILYFVPICFIFFLFTFGIGTIMMHYGVFVSDLGYIIEIVLRMLMYLTGIFYSISKRVPEPFGNLLEKFNPVACLIASMRNVLLYDICPEIGLLALWAFISMILIALGVFTVYSNENAYVRMI